MLNSHHTFSFANYHNPERMNFGVLRVLNDDRVMAGQGFGTHPHDNMEIISIPLEGDLEHKDSMGNVAVIREGDVQVMSRYRYYPFRIQQKQRSRSKIFTNMGIPKRKKCNSKI